MVGELEFEKPILELKQKISDLKEFTKSAEVDLSSEIEKLEIRLNKLEKDIYGNITPWDRVQIARHPNRPTTLDYISSLFTDFFECHGDRTFGDDEAIVGGIAKFKGFQSLLLVINEEKIRRRIFAEILECHIQKDIEKHFD